MRMLCVGRLKMRQVAMTFAYLSSSYQFKYNFTYKHHQTLHVSVIFSHSLNLEGKLGESVCLGKRAYCLCKVVPVGLSCNGHLPDGA